MSNRKRQYQKKPFESTGVSSDTSANIYMSMLTSEAFMSLTASQRVLYLYCKAQHYGEKKKDSDDQFTMNRFKWQEKYGLYKKGNEKGFYRDMNRLIEVGLIDCVFCGADSRTKSVYRFSERWQKYGTDEYVVPETVKTIAYRGTRKGN